MKYVVFDLETIPNADLMDKAPVAVNALKPPANYKSEDAIERWREGKLADVVKTMSLNPLLGRICCGGYGVYEDGIREEVGTFILDSENNESESNVVDQLGDILASADKIISFNGKKFDVPFLATRGRITRVDVPFISTNPYDTSQHIDLYMELPQSMSLDEIRMWYGIGKETENLGSQVYNLWKEGKKDEIAAHCVDDIEATAKLADLLNVFQKKKTMRMTGTVMGLDLEVDE